MNSNVNQSSKISSSPSIFDINFDDIKDLSLPKQSNFATKNLG